jgi:hypothetical protein
VSQLLAERTLPVGLLMIRALSMRVMGRYLR